MAAGLEVSSRGPVILLPCRLRTAMAGVRDGVGALAGHGKGEPAELSIHRGDGMSRKTKLDEQEETCYRHAIR